MQLRFLMKHFPLIQGNSTSFHLKPEETEQCLSIACPTTCWHLILKRRGHHRCFFCGEADVTRGPQGWKNEKNANDPKGAWTANVLSHSANNCVFPTPFCVLILSYILKEFSFAIFITGKPEQEFLKEHFPFSTFLYTLQMSVWPHFGKRESIMKIISW